MFGHLQIKSCYSFQHSSIIISDLVKTAKLHHIDALALCDEDNMYGTFEFYKTCKKEGIKPIIGLEASIKVEEESYPFTLLAMDDTGYYDLVHICTEINLSKEHSIPIEELVKRKDHLFILSASPHGMIEGLIMKEMETDAEKYMRLFKEMFLDHYYIMVQEVGIALLSNMNRRLKEMARYIGVKVVCGNDVIYLKPSDALAVDLMKASMQGQTLDINYNPITTEQYLKTEEAMHYLFDDEIMKDTEELISFCHATIPEGVKNLPHFPTPNNANQRDYLKRLCIVGLRKRFNGGDIPRTYKQRLQYELNVIHSMGFDDYFLIVWDYVRYAKVNKIAVGPGRGSAAGSLVAYVLGITNVDPIKYDLLFERFLNPERVSMPDIDIDFQDDRRDEVIRYVVEKYGQDHVAQIVTYSTYGPRNAIKDLGKVLGISVKRLEAIAKLVPTGPRNKKSVPETYRTSARFQEMVNATPGLSHILGAISIVERLPRNISMHAAGVVISSDPVSDTVPLTVGPSGRIMTQYEKDYIEEAGLLKMDFLALKNLTLITYILKDIKEKEGLNIDLNTLPLDNKKAYALLSRGDTLGVFQLESAGMRAMLRRMKPYCFDDIVAAIALYRPGPMKNIDNFLERRAHPDQVTYLLPDLEEILKPTFGIIVYQEQIMSIAVKIAGFSMGKADVLRKGVSKKNSAEILKMKESFIEGAIHNGYKEEDANKIYDLIERFADYGFNKSHSVAYAYIAYQAAYMKSNYPLYFFASALSNEAASETKKMNYIEESKRYGVKILPPSINHSSDRFIVEGNSIRHSLVGIKNVGMAGYRAIVEERENGLFKDMYDFLSRMESYKINIRMLESLVDAGAFDEFEDNRAYLKANLSTMIEYAHLSNTIGVDEPPILRYAHDDRRARLEAEKEVLGVYLSTHPIVLVKEKLNRRVVPLMKVDQYLNRNIPIVMSMTKIRVITTKKGEEMAFIEGQDETGKLEVTCFPRQFTRFRSELVRGKIVLMEIKVQERDHVISPIVNIVKGIGK